METENISRQSMSSSIVSTATASTENTEHEEENLFAKRWVEETEMDKSLKLLRRKQAATVRLRKMNDVHDRMLEDRIRFLSTNFTHMSNELRKETNVVKGEIHDIDDNKPGIQLPRIESATSILTDSRSTSRLSDNRNNQHGNNVVKSQSREHSCKTCMFNPNNTSLRCLHFPCVLPSTYNSLSELNTKRQRAQTYSVVRNYKQLIQRCKDVRPATSQLRQEVTRNDDDAVDMDSRAPRTTIKEKLRGLKQLVKEMKERNEKTKPRAWAINYGDPLPRRIILNPVKTF